MNRDWQELVFWPSFSLLKTKQSNRNDWIDPASEQKHDLQPVEQQDALSDPSPHSIRAPFGDNELTKPIKRFLLRLEEYVFVGWTPDRSSMLDKQIRTAAHVS